MAAVELYKQDGDYFQGVNKASCGYKLLEAMGWQEGEGLGAQKQGIKTHVKVKKKIDNAGVGKTEADARTRDWTLGMAAYERLLSNLTEITSTQQPSTSEAATDASGGAGSSSSSDGQLDAASSSSSEEERVVPRRRVTHRGRFKKREASKAVSAYSCEDLTAIIGATAAIVGDANTRDGNARDSSGEATLPAPRRKKRKQLTAAAVQEECTVNIELEEDASRSAAELRAASDAKSWWRGYFCRAGPTGAAGRPLSSRKVGFSEDDQVALYNLNKEQERCGRQGLGVRGMPPKVAGARWKGTKTKLGSDSEDDGVEDVHEVEAEEDATQGVVIIMPRVEKSTQPKAAPTPKWRKLTRGVLQNHGGSLSMKKLQARVLALAEQRGAHGGEALVASWLAVVHGSRKFVVDGRNVRLR